ncbi:hypothetical protein SAMN05216428_101239 [Nitrosospira sp. Nsp11]|nr:hypothetical protein SAMN05216428_101239 [Nitrosospira sp. Nsp11]
MYAATPEMSAFSFAHSYWSCTAAGGRKRFGYLQHCGQFLIKALNKSHAGPDYFIQ